MGERSRVFAYGSLLRDLRTGFDAEAQAWLPDHAPRFRRRKSDGFGALDAAPAVGCACPGWIFAVEPAVLEDLDKREGTPHAYARQTLGLINVHGERTEAEVYTVVRPERFVPASESYVQDVYAGYQRFHLEPTPIEDAVADRPPKPLPVFVYGTLREGGSNHFILQRHRRRTVHGVWVPGGLRSHGPYPSLTRDDGQVKGELVYPEDAPPCFADLDRLEGFFGFGDANNLYDRTLVRVQPRGEWAWVYRPKKPVDHLPRVPGDCWIG